MAAPTVTGAAAGTEAIKQQMILREAEWTLPKAAKGVAAKGAAAKGVAAKGVAVKGVAVKGAAATGAAANAAAVQNMVQAKVGTIPPGLEPTLCTHLFGCEFPAFQE